MRNPDIRPTRPSACDGFTLAELLVALAIMSVAMAGALMMATQATRLNQVASETLTVNRDLTSVMDLMVRDLTQVAQGLPSAKAIRIPSGTSVTVNRPAPAGTTLTMGTGTTTWNAVLPGPGLGPKVNGGPQTDMVTILYADPTFVTTSGSPPSATVAANGASMTITSPPMPIEASDLILFQVGTGDATQVVTSVTTSGTTQTVQFASGDKLGLNQRSATAGTIMQIQPTANQTFTALVSRLRLITYYVDASRTPAALMRCVGIQCVGVTATRVSGQVVGLGVENLQFSFDISDGDTNPANIKMTAADQGGTGACSPDPCQAGQIRKVNLVLSLRSRHKVGQLGDYVHRMLATQVSLRNLSFMDRYPG